MGDAVDGFGVGRTRATTAQGVLLGGAIVAVVSGFGVGLPLVSPACASVVSGLGAAMSQPTRLVTGVSPWVWVATAAVLVAVLIAAERGLGPRGAMAVSGAVLVLSVVGCLGALVVVVAPLLSIGESLSAG